MVKRKWGGWSWGSILSPPGTPLSSLFLATLCWDGFGLGDPHPPSELYWYSVVCYPFLRVAYGLGLTGAMSFCCALLWALLVAQMVKNLPAKLVTQVRPLGGENALVKGMATHSSILAWRNTWTEEPGGLESVGSQKVRQDWAINTLLLIHFKFWCFHLTCEEKLGWGRQLSWNRILGKGVTFWPWVHLIKQMFSFQAEVEEFLWWGGRRCWLLIPLYLILRFQWQLIVFLHHL